MFDKKLKKLRYLLSELKYWLKIRVGPFNEQRTTDPGSRLVDPVDDEDVEEIVHELISNSDKWTKETE